MSRQDSPSARDSSDAGFAAADGLIALTLVSVLVVLVLNATTTGLKATRAGAGRRAAAAEAEYRLATEWPQLAAPGERSGRTAAGGTWRLTAKRSAAADETGALCDVVTSVSGGSPSRTYRLETVRFCRLDAAAP